jgi:hypothetical protein
MGLSGTKKKTFRGPHPIWRARRVNGNNCEQLNVSNCRGIGRKRFQEGKKEKEEKKSPPPLAPQPP